MQAEADSSSTACGCVIACCCWFFDISNCAWLTPVGVPSTVDLTLLLLLLVLLLLLLFVAVAPASRAALHQARGAGGRCCCRPCSRGGRISSGHSRRNRFRSGGTLCGQGGTALTTCHSCSTSCHALGSMQIQMCIFSVFLTPTWCSRTQPRVGRVPSGMLWLVLGTPRQKMPLEVTASDT